MSHNNQWYIVNLNGADGELASDNLVLHLKFDDGDGVTSPIDSSSSGYTSTFNNLDGSEYEEGKFGLALRFGGGGTEWVDVNQIDDDIEGLSEISVATWVKSDATNTDDSVFFGAAPNNSDNILGLRYDASGVSGGGTNVIKFSIDNDSNQVNAA